MNGYFHLLPYQGIGELFSFKGILSLPSNIVSPEMSLEHMGRG